MADNLGQAGGFVHLGYGRIGRGETRPAGDIALGAVTEKRANSQLLRLAFFQLGKGGGHFDALDRGVAVAWPGRTPAESSA